MKARLRHFRDGTSGEDLGWALQVQCPGCALRKGWGGLHQVGVLGPNGESAYGEQWDWDRDLETPTLSPSIAVSSGPGNVVCHSYLEAGQWRYLDDCTHQLAGRIVDMVELPDWLQKEPEDSSWPGLL